jgi:hypothetical protein
MIVLTMYWDDIRLHNVTLCLQWLPLPTSPHVLGKWWLMSPCTALLIMCIPCLLLWLHSVSSSLPQHSHHHTPYCFWTAQDVGWWTMCLYFESVSFDYISEIPMLTYCPLSEHQLHCGDQVCIVSGDEMNTALTLCLRNQRSVWWPCRIQPYGCYFVRLMFALKCS